MATSSQTSRDSILTKLMALWAALLARLQGRDPEGVEAELYEGVALQAAHGTSGAFRGLASDTRGQGQSLPNLMIGVLVSAILGVAVVIPVVNDVINDSNISGTTLVVVGLIPLMIGVLLIVTVASPIMTRM